MRWQLVSGGQKTPIFCTIRIAAALNGNGFLHRELLLFDCGKNQGVFATTKKTAT
jgi:hypothetical protein